MQHRHNFVLAKVGQKFGNHLLDEFTVNHAVRSSFVNEFMCAAFWPSKDGMAHMRLAMKHSFKSVQTVTESVRTTLVKLKDQYDMSFWKTFRAKSFRMI